MVFHISETGALVDALGLYGFVCKKAPGRPARHHTLNDLVARAMASACIPVSRKHKVVAIQMESDPMVFLIPWQAGKPSTWDVTVVCPLADSYVATAARVAGSMSELAAARK